MPTLAELDVVIRANLKPFNDTMIKAEKQILDFQKKLNQAGSGSGSAFNFSGVNKKIQGVLTQLEKMSKFDMTHIGVELLEIGSIIDSVKKDVAGLNTEFSNLSRKKLKNIDTLKQNLTDVIRPLENFVTALNSVGTINNPFDSIGKDLKSIKSSLSYMANLKVGDRLSKNFEKIQAAAAYVNPIIAQLEHNFKSLAGLQFPDLTKLSLQLNTIGTSIKKISENLNKVQGEQRFNRLATNLERLKTAANGLADPLMEVAKALNSIHSPNIGEFGTVFHQLRNDIRALRTDISRLQTSRGSSTRTNAASLGAFGGAELSSASRNGRYLSTGGPSIMTGALAGVATGISVHQLQQYADTYTGLQNRLATTAALTGTYVASLDDLRKAANESNTSLETTANLYARLAFSGSKYLKNEDEVMALTKTLQKGLLLSGATASETNSAITQFTQSIAAGRLNGDELRSLVENAPILINAIAKEFGVNPGDLKDMGARGELEIRRVLKGILSVTDDIEDAFGKIDKSIEATFQTLRNNFIMWLGRSDDVVKATEKINAVILGVANNIDAIAYAAAAAAAALLVMSAPAIAAAIANPWIGLPLLIGTATGLIYKFGDEINLLESQTGTLGDAIDVLWSDMKSSAEQTTEAIKPLFEALVQAINGDLKEIDWDTTLNEGYKSFQRFIVETKYEFLIFAQIVKSTIDLFTDGVKQIITLGGLIPSEIGDDLKSIMLKSIIGRLNPLAGIMDATNTLVNKGIESGVVGEESPIAKLMKERKAALDAVDANKSFTDRVAAKNVENALVEGGIKLENPDRIDAAFELFNNANLTMKDNVDNLMEISKNGLSIDKSAGYGGSIPEDAYKYLLSRKASDLPDSAITELKADSAEAFARWLQAMTKAGLPELPITSGYRSFEKQKQLYDDYQRGKGNLAAPPGKSTHQQGVTIDVMGLRDLSPEQYAIAVGLAGEQGIKFPVKTEKWHATHYGENAKYIKNATTGRQREDSQFANDFERGLFDSGQSVKELEVQYDVLQRMNPLLDDYGYQLAFAEEQRRLLSLAEKEGIELSPEQNAAIDQAAQKYAEMTKKIKELQNQQQLAQARVDDLRNTTKDVFGGMIKDMKNGVSAAEALANALDKISDKIVDMTINYLFDTKEKGGSGIFDSFFNEGGNAIGKFFGSLFGADSGGYTGNVPTDQVTGWHHGQEYVLNANATKAIGVGNLDKINATGNLPTIAVPNYNIAKSTPQTVHVVLEAQTDPSVIMQISDSQIQKAAPGIVTTSVVQSQKTTKRNMSSMMIDAQNKVL